MIYKPFKEINLPALGMGVMQLQSNKEGSPEDHAKNQALIDYAMENGINYFDTAYIYGKDGSSEKCLGELLTKYPRQSYYLSTKYSVYGGDDYNSVFEEQLTRLKTDYIDFYLLHSVFDDTYQRYIDNGCIKYFEEQQRKGRIKYLGFSSHAGIETLMNLVNCRSWDFAMLQINCYDWVYGLANQEYEILNQRGIPIIVMEPVRGGRLATLSPKAEAILKDTRPDWSIASWFFRWVKRLSGVQTVLSGMRTLDQLRENNMLFSCDESLDDEGEKRLIEVCEIFRQEVSVICTSCLYCQNDCPAEINIPRIIELYNHYKTDKPWDIKKKIESADSKGKPVDCTGCGVCISRCPQKIDVVNIMKELCR